MILIIVKKEICMKHQFVAVQISCGYVVREHGHDCYEV
jgi:hypothetical protein